MEARFAADGGPSTVASREGDDSDDPARESLPPLASLLDLLSDPTILAGPTGLVRYVNTAAAALLRNAEPCAGEELTTILANLTAGEAPASTITLSRLDDDAGSWTVAVVQSAPSPADLPQTNATADRDAPAEAVLSRDDAGETMRIAGAVADIAGAHRTGETLRAGQERLQLMASTFNGALYEWDFTNKRTLYIGALVGEQPRSDDGTVPGWWVERAHPEDAELAGRAVASALAGGALDLTSEYRFRGPHGEWIDIWDRARIIRDEDGNPERVVGTMVDVTALKRVQERSRDTEMRYQALVEQIPAYVAATDSQASILYLSPKSAEILGLDEVEATIPDIWARMLHEADRGRVLEEIAVATRSGQPLSSQYRMVRKDGTVIWIQAQAVIVRDDLERPIFMQGVMFDVTAQKEQEAALSLANAKLQDWVEALEHRERESKLLSELSEILQACLSEDEAYGVFAPFAQQLFPGTGGALSITKASRNVIETATSWDFDLPADYFTQEDCWAPRRGRTHVVHDIATGMVCRHLPDDRPGSYVCVPLISKGEPLGVLYVSHADSGAFTPELERLAATVGETVSLSMANLKLRETLRLQSIRDPLTGLFNRRYMEESLNRELSRCHRNRKTLSVLMMDIDHFKQFNDSFGHEAGDTLLKALGDFLLANTRAEDIACRYGGEELTLIFPDSGVEDAARRADELREGIKRLDVRSRGATLGTITVSVGVATFPQHGANGAGLLHLADEALYRAKHNGRDRVVLASRHLAEESASA